MSTEVRVPISRKSLQSLKDNAAIEYILDKIYKMVIKEAELGNTKSIKINITKLSIEMNNELFNYHTRNNYENKLLLDDPTYYKSKCLEYMSYILNELQKLFPDSSVKQAVLKVDSYWNEYDPDYLKNPTISPSLYLCSLSEHPYIIIE
jgi:hypothetical protein